MLCVRRWSDTRPHDRVLCWHVLPLGQESKTGQPKVQLYNDPLSPSRFIIYPGVEECSWAIPFLIVSWSPLSAAFMRPQLLFCHGWAEASTVQPQTLPQFLPPWSRVTGLSHQSQNCYILYLLAITVLEERNSSNSPGIFRIADVVK